MSETPLAQRVESIRTKLHLGHALPPDDQEWLLACIEQMDREHAHHSIPGTVDCFGCALLNAGQGIAVLIPYEPSDHWRLRHAIISIMQERVRQDTRWGDDHDSGHSDTEWAALISEYSGKLSRAASFEYGEDQGVVHRRLVQVAALCLAALEHRPNNWL